VLSVQLGSFRWRSDRKSGRLLALGAYALGEAVLADEQDDFLLSIDDEYPVLTDVEGVCQLIVRNAREHVTSEELKCCSF
jgi:hypothetical protein